MGLIGGGYEVWVGVDVGQSKDPTAVVVADPEVRNKEIHYLVRFPKRLELGLEYPKIVENLKQIFVNIRKYTVGYPMCIQAWVDATGVGKPVVDLLRKELPEDTVLHEVYLTGEEAKKKVDTGAFSITLPKAYMVSRLQVLVSYGRIHLPNTPDALAAREELMNYQIKVNENGHVQFEAKTGKHDDLVTALGLACLHEPQVWDLDFMDEMIAMEIAERRFGHLRFSGWEDFFRKTAGWKKR
jgi:hypothetical protein